MNHRHNGPKVRYRTSRGNIRFRERPIHNLSKMKKKYKIRIVGPSALKGYGGMNYYAAKHLNFKPLPGKDEILIEQDKKNFMDSTILHEITEIRLMKKGMEFDNAHRKSMEAEISAGFVPKDIIIKNNEYLIKKGSR